MKILITGGSGFIGTNAVEFYLSKGIDVLNVDIKDPQNSKHEKVSRKVDILDRDLLVKTFADFEPTHILHLAARTDLHETKNIEGYNANIVGVKNVIYAISHQSSVERCIFTSTKLICPTDYMPTSDEDYCPTTLYGKSKVIGEQIVKDSNIHCSWCIIRPTSIWGPWSIAPHIPYGKFFLLIAKGFYFHPGSFDSPKCFGYVGNSIFQILKIFNASSEQVNKKVFYIADYDKFTIREWANLISLKLRGGKVATLPDPFVYFLAKCGDLLKLFGIREPYFSTFRLKNMRSDTSKIPLEPLKRITGQLPYTMEQGVKETIFWLKTNGYLKQWI